MIDAFLQTFQDHAANLSILDLGCGSGCIAITVLTLYPNATALLADINPAALNIAKKNAKKHNVIQRCKFCITNWFSNINQKFDAVLTNPPYIKTNEKLSKETMYDPKIALFAGKDGMDAYRNIFKHCHSNYIFTEIGKGQLNMVTNIAIKNFTLINIKNDLSSIPRILIFKKSQ